MSDRAQERKALAEKVMAFESDQFTRSPEHLQAKCAYLDRRVIELAVALAEAHATIAELTGDDQKLPDEGGGPPARE